MFPILVRTNKILLLCSNSLKFERQSIQKNTNKNRRKRCKKKKKTLIYLGISNVYG